MIAEQEWETIYDELVIGQEVNVVLNTDKRFDKHYVFDSNPYLLTLQTNKQLIVIPWQSIQYIEAKISPNHPIYRKNE